MRRMLVAMVSAVCMIGAAALVGGKAGLIGGTLATLLIAFGAVFGTPMLITAAAAAIAGTYLAGLVLTGSPVDLQAPLIGTLLVVAMEIGHLSFTGDRYLWPGGTAALAIRAVFTAGVCLLGLAAAWLVLLSAYAVPLPGETASLMFGVAGVIAVLAVLVVLRRSYHIRESLGN